jgi:oxygen-dependent protoporphyrinogen oxidase
LRATLFNRSSQDSSPKPANDSNKRSPTEAAPATNTAASGARYGMFIAPKHGMSSMVRSLARCLPPERLHLNSPVQAITTTGQMWKVTLSSDASPASASPEFDGIVVALPAPHAAVVLESVDGALSGELSAIEYASCAIVCLGFNRDQFGDPLDGFGFVVPHSERRRIIAGSFASLKFPGRAPEQQVLVRVFIGGALQPEMLKLSDAELTRIAREELAELLRMKGEPIFSEVVRWMRSMPQYHVGHLDRVARIESLTAAHPGLALAGNAYRGVGIPQCIASGQAEAERLATQFAGP